MYSRVLLAVLLVLASGAVLSKMSECETDCETSYKVCGTSGKSSAKVCLAEREKCRKACIKKDKAGFEK